MSSEKYRLPARLDFLDQYGKIILTILVVALFAASLIGYVYLNFFGKSLDVTEVLIREGDYDVMAIHQATVMP